MIVLDSIAGAGADAAGAAVDVDVDVVVAAVVPAVVAIEADNDAAIDELSRALKGVGGTAVS